MKRWVTGTAIAATLSSAGLMVGTAGPALATPSAVTSLVQSNQGCHTYPPRRPTVTLTYTRDGHGGITLTVRITRGSCVINNVVVTFHRGKATLGHDKTGKHGYASAHSRPLYPAVYKYYVTYHGITKTIWVKMPGVSHKPHPAP